MRFKELDLPGAFLIEPERMADERGFFARSWCLGEFEKQGIQCAWVQCNISFNRQRGTLRGLHYQVAPWEEPKLVRCTRGSIYDVLVDLRPESPTYGKWTAVELTAENCSMAFIPGGLAHGFQTLSDESEVFYQMGQWHQPESARGLRWDDPALGINWPRCDRRIISARDQGYPDFKPCRT